ncbi:11386_t:CDS:2 [Racocetra fulgida]|uniref:11386_t:CDS:1 n=1 Tax=Racocetra fulgida TaxID=60492 RepID=A0A9N9FJC7_9GLOM|nr:11386_t:CDS:2 [Racocetra fulgida]
MPCYADTIKKIKYIKKSKKEDVKPENSIQTDQEPETDMTEKRSGEDNKRPI